jgi:hypothetical protein
LVTLLAFALAAMAGAFVGTIVHEASHAAVAAAVGTLERVTWRGGVTGGPVVEFRAGEPGGRRDELVRKAPLGLGLIGLAVTLATSTPRALWWWWVAGATLGCLWSSPADMFTDAAAVSDDHA